MNHLNHPLCASIISTDRAERVGCLMELLESLPKLPIYLMCDFDGSDLKGLRRYKKLLFEQDSEGRRQREVVVVRAESSAPETESLKDCVVIIDISDPSVRKHYYELTLTGESNGITTIILTDTLCGKWGMSPECRRMQDIVFYSARSPVDISALESAFETKNLAQIK